MLPQFVPQYFAIECMTTYISRKKTDTIQIDFLCGFNYLQPVLEIYFVNDRSAMNWKSWINFPDRFYALPNLIKRARNIPDRIMNGRRTFKRNNDIIHCIHQPVRLPCKR